MIRFAFVGVALAVFAGCVNNGPGDDQGDGSDNGSDKGSGSGSGSGGGSNGSGSGSGSGGGGAISPRAGAWLYGEITPVSTTCGPSTPTGEAGPFAIDQVVPASFRIIPGDGTAAFTCTTTGAKFSCPNRASFVKDYRPGLDAMLTVHATATGTFSDVDHATGRQTATVDCAGSQCGVVGTLPCGFTVDFKILTR
jgi:hypothetical protein